MALVHPAMPPAGVGGMMMEDIQLEHQYQTAPFVQHATNSPTALYATAFNHHGAALNTAIPDPQPYLIEDPRDGPWPMDQDTDLVPIIIDLIRFLHLGPHSAMDTEDTTGIMNPADFIANAIHASYHRGYQDAQRQQNANRQTETRLAADTGYTNGFAACIQEAEARFLEVRDEIVQEGYQQGLDDGERRTRLIMELALADFMGRADAAAFERGRLNGVASESGNSANIRASAYTDGQAVGEATARQAAQQEADRLRLQAEHIHQQEVQRLNTTITSLRNVVNHAAENERRLRARLDATVAEEGTRADQQRVQLLEDIERYRHGIETAQRALAERLDELENLREMHRTSLQRETSMQATIQAKDRQIAERMEQQRRQHGAFQRLASENLELAGEVAAANRTIATLNQEVDRHETQHREQTVTINNLGVQVQEAHGLAATAIAAQNAAIGQATAATAARNDALADAAAADALTALVENRATAAENRANDAENRVAALEQRLADATAGRDHANARAADAEQRVDRLERELQAQNRDPDAYHDIHLNPGTVPLQEGPEAEYAHVAPDTEMASNDDHDHDYGHGYNESEDEHNDDEEPDTETDEPSAIRIDDDAGPDDMDAQSETSNDQEAAEGHDGRHTDSGTEGGRPDSRDGHLPGLMEGHAASLKEANDIGFKEGHDAGFKEGREAGMKEVHDEYLHPDAELNKAAILKESFDNGVKAGLLQKLTDRPEVRRKLLCSRLKRQDLYVLLNNASVRENTRLVIRQLDIRPHDVLRHLENLTEDEIEAFGSRPELQAQGPLQALVSTIGRHNVAEALRDSPVERSRRFEPTQAQCSAARQRTEAEDNSLASMLDSFSMTGDPMNSLLNAMNDTCLNDDTPAVRGRGQRNRNPQPSRPRSSESLDRMQNPLQDITAQDNVRELAIGPSSRQVVTSRSMRRGAKAPYSLGESG